MKSDNDMARHRHRPVIIRCALMRPGWTLNLFGVLLTCAPESVDAVVVNHELIHSAQMRELLWVPFYIAYGVEWLWRMLLTRNAMQAYRSVSFEREAYAHGSDLGYLQYRVHYAQWRRARH